MILRIYIDTDGYRIRKSAKLIEEMKKLYTSKIPKVHTGKGTKIYINTQKGYMYPNVHTSIIIGSNLRAHNRWKGKEDLVYVYNGKKFPW